jgi:hypothetical protein
MKYLILSILLSLPALSMARPCEVYGISDSPQKLSCTFPAQKIALTCVNGNYFLNSSKVKTAYHLEVESGPTPLVFEAKELEMTVVIDSKIDIKAELVRNGRSLQGTCL